ncbi:hypothetical protein [Candidatus Spongiisocius sp.]|uniref:phospholipase D family protein n=1 Tax=Candidatus Spongiisocius sp. TaxID=3101273 RepID=UPI003B58C7CE
MTLIDAMRPPARFELESAMAVTFTLNLSALLAAPAAFAIAGSGDNKTHVDVQTPVELIHALRTNSHKLTVFAEAGMIGLPTASRAFAFLERAVVSVRPPRGGIVHPKVWVLRYQASADLEEVKKGDQRLRVIITSRNLTFDRSWDTVLRLDESIDSEGAQLVQVGKLFEGLLGNTVGTVSEDHSERVHSLAGALRTARFALPSGIDGLRIHVLGFTSKRSPLPTAADRSLIISPFLTDDFFTRICPRPVDELVSRQEWLDRLEVRTLDPIKNVWVLDSTLDDRGDSESGDSPDDPAQPQLSPSDPGRPLVGLHAKVFAFEQDGQARLFVGSANATGPAFENNLEILAELQGPVDKLGIDRLTEGNGDEPGLRALFDAYCRSDPTVDDEPAAINFSRAIRAIARVPFSGEVEKSGEDWAVTYRSTEPVPSFKDIEIHCRPLTFSGDRRQIAPGQPLEERFETSLERMSGFLAFELSHESGEEAGFVVPVPLEGVPEHRDRHLLKLLIGNAERFLRYLLALLYEDSTQVDLGTVIRSMDTDRSDGNSRVNLAVLERLLRTMRRDPSRLLGLHPLVDDLKHDDSLPEGFAGLWEAIHSVTTEEAGRR